MAKQIYAKEYEDYLITGKEDSLNSLVNGSIEKDYFILIRKLLNENLTKELQKQINKFIKRIPESQSYRLTALNFFKKLQKNPKNKNEIIQDIKKLFNLENAQIYNKPIKYNETLNNDEKEEKLPNTLILSNYNKIDKLIDDIYTNKIDPNDEEYVKFFGKEDYRQYNLIFNFNKIPEKILVKIFLDYKHYNRIYGSVIKSITYAKLDYFKKILKSVVDECLKDKNKKNDFRHIITNNIQIFLNEQIIALLEYNEIFNFDSLVSELISRKYSEITEDRNEKIKKLKEIKQLLNKYQYKNDKMTRNVLISLLALNSQINIFDFDLFIEYIKCPLYNNYSIYKINNQLQKIIENNNNQIYFKCQIIEFDSYKETQLIEKYLKHFYLKDKMTFEKLNKYFNANYIKKFYSKMQFYLGKEGPTKDNILSSYEIENLMNEIILTICDYNKELFNVNDDIEITLEIKNIQTLFVNIYEINTENYYYSNKKEFDENNCIRWYCSDI